MKLAITVLSLVCLALAAALLSRYQSNNRSPDQRQTLEERVAAYSNQIDEVRTKLDEQEKLSGYLQSNLTFRTAQLVTASNKLDLAASALAQVENHVRLSEAESQKLAARVTAVEGERDGLQTRLNQLAQKINSLDDQITETRRQLASAEGDRDFLAKELTRLQTDKAELLRQFNDVAAVRAQLALLKEEAAVNQRLQWMAQGVYQRGNLKGAQILVSRPAAVANGGKPSLDVELERNKPATPETAPVPSEPVKPAVPETGNPAVPEAAGPPVK